MTMTGASAGWTSPSYYLNQERGHHFVGSWNVIGSTSGTLIGHWCSCITPEKHKQSENVDEVLFADAGRSYEEGYNHGWHDACEDFGIEDVD